MVNFKFLYTTGSLKIMNLISDSKLNPETFSTPEQLWPVCHVCVCREFMVHYQNYITQENECHMWTINCVCRRMCTWHQHWWPIKGHHVQFSLFLLLLKCTHTHFVPCSFWWKSQLLKIVDTLFSFLRTNHFRQKVFCWRNDERLCQMDGSVPIQRQNFFNSASLLIFTTLK